MEPTSEQLVMYGQPSSARMLAWSWVQAQLEAAGTYWVIARGPGHPHPRPVWGVWHANVLHLSVGSPIVASSLDVDPLVTVHLGSDTDVVIVEGTVTGRGDGDRSRGGRGGGGAVRREVRLAVRRGRVRAADSNRAADRAGLRSTGWAGRDGFEASGRWRLTGA